ncbi:ubl carboxyl-terminal hydrolase 18 isoform X1 [Chrysemys picta bellii]|uniref:ubl carboxyl-terminal hydrolase 18 isoform X1 n=1 Tax=Chrysemys picta bellii TaxID=8478 RepID=UPI0032B1A502
MGQGIGCPEKSRKSEPALNQSMKKAEDGEESREEAVERGDKQLRALHGVADLNNGAIGLYNMGLSCCLNSLLQVFLMNTHFTVILRRIRVPTVRIEQKKSVPYQMLLLLEQMQCSKRRAVYPQELVSCLTWHNLKLFVQYDAAQLFLSLWNLIKSQITDEQLADRLTMLYTIWVQEYLVCQKCSFETRRDSNMLSLPLPMFNSCSQRLKTLEDSLRCFFQPELLTDNNMCLCEQCERKTPCLQGMRLTCLPHTLTLHLKRFYYKKSSWTQKISYSLPFPQSLDFNQILTQEQCHPDAKEKADWQYELFGVVAHSGLASFGHYCAYIRSLTEGKWYCFNDSSVCQVSWDDVKCTYGNSHTHWSETAYLLVYMRKNPQ